MTIEATFGSRINRFNNAATVAEAPAEKRPAAEFWLNPGFATEDPKYPFVSLPVGIPLSLDDRKDIRGSSEYAALLSAQNELLEDIIAEAQNLKPGEDMIVMMPVQIRRVRGEQAQVPSESNPLSPRGRGIFMSMPSTQAAE